MRITVNRELCAGAGNCVMSAPAVFDQDDTEGLVMLRLAEPSENLRTSVELAAQMCPVGAIDVMRQATTH
ncbi:ferredoxin [Streptomyces sp. NPDC014894]|uniref:ferredoxin n=1 Tax=unclassified Streptomyces TaxID=2593676 RepID=UPI003703097C